MLKNYDLFLNEEQNKDSLEWKRIKLACINISNNFHFFADLLYKLRIRESEEVETMATDGVNIYYNPAFSKKFTQPMIEFILMHEILHCAFQHFMRRNNRDHYKWNIATDYAINVMLNQEKAIQFPMENGERVGLLDQKFDKWSADAIYDYLEKNNEWPQTGDGDWNFGECMDTNELSGKDVNDMPGPKKTFNGSAEIRNAVGDTNREKMAEVWESLVRRSFQKNPGDLPGSLKTRLQEMFKPKVNWRAELRKFISDIFNKLSFKMPSRRFVHSGDYMYGTKQTLSDYSNVVIGIDTSASVDDDYLAQFGSEIASLSKAQGIKDLTVIYCDTEVRGVQTFNMYNQFTLKKMEFKGRGGTKFEPVFKWINLNMINRGKKPAFIIYFTDAGCDSPPKSLVSQYLDRILWVISGPDNGKHLNFGTKILLGETRR